MTQADKDWLDERFKRVYDHVEPVCKRLDEVEKKTAANSKFIWILTGAGMLAGALISLIIGIFQFSINK
jgi:hypothetical protein